MTEHRPYFLVVAAVAAGVSLLVAPYLVARLRGTNRVAAIPVIHLSALVNGEPIAAGGVVGITLDDEITPLVRVDWRGGKPGVVGVTWGKMSVTPGEPFRAGGLGVGELRASAETDSGLFMEDIVIFEITSNPRFDAVAMVRDIDTGPGDPRSVRAVTVRLSCDEFDIENIWLSHASLWLMTRDTDLDRLPVASTGAVEEGGEPDYAAEFEDGAWTLRFERPAAAPPLEQWPTEIMITGSGWRGEETVEFVARGTFPTQTANP